MNERRLMWETVEAAAQLIAQAGGGRIGNPKALAGLRGTLTRKIDTRADAFLPADTKTEAEQADATNRSWEYQHAVDALAIANQMRGGTPYLPAEDHVLTLAEAVHRFAASPDDPERRKPSLTPAAALLAILAVAISPPSAADGGAAPAFAGAEDRKQHMNKLRARIRGLDDLRAHPLAAAPVPRKLPLRWLMPILVMALIALVAVALRCWFVVPAAS